MSGDIPPHSRTRNLGPRGNSATASDEAVDRAMRRSIVVLAAIVLILGGFWAWNTYRHREVATEAAPLVAPTLRDRPRVEIPHVTFTDITRESGIDFIHTNGAYGEKLLPETMGGGCAIFDVDNDGDQDVLLVDSQHWPWRGAADNSAKPRGMARLYLNDGRGHFTDATAGSGLELPGYGMGVAVGDFDNDGLVDIYLTAVGRNHLLRNRGNARFDDVTTQAGVGGDDNQWSTGAAWLDYDRDGDLDLFVAHYVHWSRAIDLAQAFVLTGVGRAYGPPLYFRGAMPRLYRNEGHGRFTDVSAEAGVEISNPATGQPIAKSLGVTAADVDHDGWIDLVVANDTVQNFLFHNLGGGKFEEIGAAVGIGFDSAGNARGAMGIDVAHYRNDAAVGIAISNFANEMMALYVSPDGQLAFSDESVPAGLGPVTRLDLSFGLFFFDYDLDGRLDLLSANGHLEEEIGKVQASQHYRQPARLFWNAGPEHPSEFLRVPEQRCGPDLALPIVGAGQPTEIWTATVTWTYS